MRGPRDAEAGFTLVEMLIALVIFGMITAAGVTLLTLTVRTRDSAERLLDNVGALRRTDALLNADLAQAAPRIRRDGDGRPGPAFTGGNGGEALLLALVRRGWEDETALRSSLQRVEYRLRDGRLERWRYDAVDGAGRAVAMPLLQGVRRVQLRYRDRDGNWRDRWDPTDPARLPVAVELVSDSEGQGEVRQLFLVGGGR
ncbi:MAG TPA: type II secretion system minor pseudopilin GspJ [Allosphingosinicella sp.]|nr:type II secretion system minor pseudopilin GspJ [Allosphingosinicella sp.]